MTSNVTITIEIVTGLCLSFYFPIVQYLAVVCKSVNNEQQRFHDQQKIVYQEQERCKREYQT